MNKLLHVGCGPLFRQHLTRGFQADVWEEIRYDIDPAVKPDLVGSMTDIAQIPSASMDAVYSSHNLEHVFPHEVPLALGEFHRVLRPGGFVVLTCPDLQSVCASVVEDGPLRTLYESTVGPINALDILYGHRAALAEGRHYMAHKCGFTYATLCASFEQAGFGNVVGGPRPDSFDLWILAIKSDTHVPEELRMQLASLYLP